jgi:hypothetical protein
MDAPMKPEPETIFDPKEYSHREVMKIREHWMLVGYILGLATGLFILFLVRIHGS